jgi:predicted TIM-barrel fold metal-dependent hydrolase
MLSIQKGDQMKAKIWTRRKFVKTAGILSAGSIFTLAQNQWLWAAKMVNPEVFRKKTYAGLKGLTELPYFEMNDRGLLRLTVDDLEGGIDGHTHFSLNSLLGGEPDLLKTYPETRYYLPPNIKGSMYVYANQNNSPAEKKEMGSVIMRMLLPGGSPVTDSHTIPNLLEEMDLLGIDKAVVLPIRYGWPFGDDMTERYVEAVKKSGRADRFILCGSVKPTDDDAVNDVKKYHQMGLKGIKLHPNFARFFPNDKAAWPFYEICGQLDLPVLIHSGLTGYKEKKTLGMTLYTEIYADLQHFEEPIAAFPKTRFVLCHAGALQNEQAVKLARKYANVWLDIHGQGVDRVAAMIKEVGAERLMYGSDWAFYPEALILVRMLLATENDLTVRRMLFAENARRFWGFSN